MQRSRIAAVGGDAAELDTGLSMISIDPPDHTRLRRLVQKAFTPRAVEALRPRIERLVDELLDPVEAAGSADLIAGFAYPLPIIVICELLGRADERPRALPSPHRGDARRLGLRHRRHPAPPGWRER